MSVARATLLGRCPRCGQGALFDGYLKVAPKCGACGLDYGPFDAGDGPAVFVILIAGFICAFGVLTTEIAFKPPVWLDIIIWLPMSVILCLALLRPMKGLMIAAQFANRASQAGRDDL